ncbi:MULTISPECIES: hypothetical protein [Arthrobacter]|uniref:ABC transporter permease n=2 Tax=Arthrobacter TaxID=1663 RepID=A0ABU9KNE1_9MICC|nr:hypothetical protein [Arthrobacter sp. YJM1]MDP5228358.1 hypothetical protein [Arthrobacter sp. YJM1]
MSRVLAVSRMQLINKWTFLGVPAVILGGSLLLSLVIFAIIPVEDKRTGGAAFAPLWYFFVLGIQSLTLTFPFSLGMSVSRKSYFLGTHLAFGGVALGLAVVFWAGSQLERLTGGWWLNGYFFRIPYVIDGPWWHSMVIPFVAAMFFFSVGFWAATVYRRWGVTGTLIGVISLAVLVVAAVVLVTVSGSWPAVGGFFVQAQAIGVAGIVALLAAALGTGSFITLRRTAV